MGSEPLYRPFGSLVVRAPLLPVEAYLGGERERLLEDPAVALSLAVASPALAQAVSKPVLAAPARRSLLRYLTRMSTRPTPYGLFAGAALARWGTTDLALASPSHRPRTRPDMEWLSGWLRKLEADEGILRSLRLFSNRALLVRSGRVLLAQRATLDADDARGEVSIPETPSVMKVLELARAPIAFAELARQTQAATGDGLESVESLITELWRETILLSELRPTLTEDPARQAVERLSKAAPAAAARLEGLIRGMKAFDAAPGGPDARAYAELVTSARGLQTPPPAGPFQVDMALELSGGGVSKAVGEEAARAAELLLKQSRCPAGSPSVTEYRRRFLEKYGQWREVPLLELLHPELGLGPVPSHAPLGGPAPEHPRGSALLRLAAEAIRDRRAVVDLDEAALSLLETWAPDGDALPASLDLFVSVAARSAAAVDAGEFQLAVSPRVGVAGAGRSLGRFADMLGEEARALLERAAAHEAERSSDCVRAELIYLPEKARMSNVAIRPLLTTHAVVFGTSPAADPARSIGLDELVIGVSDDRFHIRWPAEDVMLSVCAGHLLSDAHAPEAVRSLAELSSDGTARLHGFDWGPAAGLPFLPRLRAGRIVLSPARWRIDRQSRREDFHDGAPEGFQRDLTQWRGAWRVPRHVHLVENDTRLLLDLEDGEQAEELRRAVERLPQDGTILLNEMLPSLDEAWVEGPGGRFLTELVVPLALQPVRRPSRATRPAPRRHEIPAAERLRVPGGDWLYAKLYGFRELEHELIGGPLREFAEEQSASGLAAGWFFIRYEDPEPHVRLRLRGDPAALTEKLLPALCRWAKTLTDRGLLRRFVIDAYDRELERYGGPLGIVEAEDLFTHDSRAAADLLALTRGPAPIVDRLTLAVLSADDLLDSLGYPPAERLRWCRERKLPRRTASIEYRELGAALGRALSGARGLGAVTAILARRNAGISPLASRLEELRGSGRLSQDRDELARSFLHMSCNRLLGCDHRTERTVLGLLLRARHGLAETRVEMIESAPC